MKADLRVKDLIGDAMCYIKVTAKGHNISDETFIDKDGRKYNYLLIKPAIMDMFTYLTEDSGKNLFNELFINDNTIVNELKSFAKKHGYIDATVGQFCYNGYVMPTFILYKS